MVQSHESAIRKLMSRYPDIHTLIFASRSALKAAFPGIQEEADLKAGLISYNYGPGYKGVVATLILSKSGVKIGIPYGAALKDPCGLLQGKGKVHRHIVITSPARLKQADVRSLLLACLEAWERRSQGV